MSLGQNPAQQPHYVAAALQKAMACFSATRGPRPPNLQGPDMLYGLSQPILPLLPAPRLPPLPSHLSLLPFSPCAPHPSSLHHAFYLPWP